jgi:DNA-directed RNA polymerase subunit RPC12/RpoP
MYECTTCRGTNLEKGGREGNWRFYRCLECGEDLRSHVDDMDEDNDETEDEE